MLMIPTLKARFLTRSKHMRIKNQKNRQCIDNGVDSEVDNKSIPKSCLEHTSPFMRHIKTQRIKAQTIGSQFPRVPIVKVNGLKSQAITEIIDKFSGTPRSFKMARINKPTSKSAAEKMNLPQER